MSETFHLSWVVPDMCFHVRYDTVRLVHGAALQRQLVLLVIVVHEYLVLAHTEPSLGILEGITRMAALPLLNGQVVAYPHRLVPPLANQTYRPLLLGN